MNISRLLLGSVILCSLPTVAQSQQNQFSPPLVSPEEAVRQALPVPIKLHLKNVTLREGLSELARQCHIGLAPINLFGPSSLEEQVSADIETPFFREALAALTKDLKLGGLRPQGFWNGGSYKVWELIPNTRKENPFICQNGPFELRLLELDVNSHNIRDFDNPSFHTNYKLLDAHFSFNNDPRLIALGIPQVRITRAIDDLGKSVGEGYVHTSRGFLTDNDIDNFEVTFSAPSPESQKISRLEGTVLYTLPVRSERWHINDIVAGKASTRTFQCQGSKVRLTIRKPSIVGTNVLLALELDAPVSDPRGVHQALPISAKQVLSQIHLYEADGRELFSKGYTARVESPGSKSIILANFGLLPRRGKSNKNQQKESPLSSFVLPLPKQLLSLDLDMPTDFIQTEVPFSFSDIPLP